MEKIKCLKCGVEYSMKDNERFSSMLCECGIVIYYYESCYDVFISKEQYLRWKKNKGGMN